MADSKLTELTENTSPSAADLLYLVDDPGGTPDSKKVTVDNLLANHLPLAGGTMTGSIAIPDAASLVFIDDNGSAHGAIVLSDVYTADAPEMIVAGDNILGIPTQPYGVRLKGAYAFMDAPNFGLQANGVKAGAPLFVAGVDDTNNVAFIGFGEPETPAYEVTSEGTTDVSLGTGGVPGAWTQVTASTVSTQEITAGTGVYVYQVYLEELSGNRDGTVEFGVGENGVAPTLSKGVLSVPGGFSGLFSATFVPSVTIEAGNTFSLWMRRFSNSNNQFNVTTRGATQTTTTLRFTEGATGGGGGEANTTSTKGTGAQLTLPKESIDLPFRSLVAGSADIGIVQNAEDVTFTVPGLANKVDSDPTGITGADQVTNIMSLTQAEYDAIPEPGTNYPSTLFLISG